MLIQEILKSAVDYGASDVHLKSGAYPTLRVHGKLATLPGSDIIPADELSKIANEMMTPQQRLRFQDFNEVDLAYSVSGLGRFRVNVFQQRGAIGMVLRVISVQVKTIDELGLPEVIKKIALSERGLVLVTGATGSGKSTSLASMLDYINENRSAHVVTIEEPIEYLIKDKKSIINQREVGVDTMGFHQALRGALRQDPDVILVGEMRDAETMETALAAAETGHLVLSTLHTLDAGETINRIVATFPSHQQRQIRLQLGSVIKAIIAQRLVPTKDGKGRVPALEVLINTGRIRELIENQERTKEITAAISEGFVSYGMQTFDQSLMALLKEEKITMEEALRQASNPHDFALRVSGISSEQNSNWDAFESTSEINNASQVSDKNKDPNRQSQALRKSGLESLRTTEPLQQTSASDFLYESQLTNLAGTSNRQTQPASREIKKK